MVSRSNLRRCMAEGWDGVVPICEGKSWNTGCYSSFSWCVEEMSLCLFLYIFPQKYGKTLFLTCLYMWKLFGHPVYFLIMFFPPAQHCPAIHVDSNVFVNGDPDEATYGNVIRFGCKSNTEVMDGLPEIYCDENGKWNGEAPKCKGTAGCPKWQQEGRRRIRKKNKIKLQFLYQNRKSAENQKEKEKKSEKMELKSNWFEPTMTSVF